MLAIEPQVGLLYNCSQKGRKNQEKLKSLQAWISGHIFTVLNVNTSKLSLASVFLSNKSHIHMGSDSTSSTQEVPE